MSKASDPLLRMTQSLFPPSCSHKVTFLRIFVYGYLLLFHGLLCLFDLNFGYQLFFWLVFPPPNKRIIKEKMFSGFSVIINKNKIFTWGLKGINMSLTLIHT